jgi:hypothetical protein
MIAGRPVGCFPGLCPAVRGSIFGLVNNLDTETFVARKPAAGAVLLALTPFLGMCFSVPLWDRVHPLLLGLPFNLMWLICWIVLGTLCLWGAYRLETAREKRQANTQ